jgi:hypothetical protein
VSKTLTIDKISNTSTKICAVNKEITDINSISPNCNQDDEYLLDCPGSNGPITCNITEGKYIVSGLTNSAVKEMIANLTSSNCTPSWTCNPWSSCATTPQQIRICIDSNNCSTLQGKPVETQACACTPQWTCSAWTPKDCPKNKTQTRICTDSNNCNSLQGKSAEEQSCTYVSKVNSKTVVWILAIVIALAVIGVIVYFIMKNFNQTKPSGGGIIISPQIPPPQVPLSPPQSYPEVRLPQDNSQTQKLNP